MRNIQSPFRSGIDIEDYQLDPVVRAIQMPRVNLLIADDVGLGKTIEAGMVAWNSSSATGPGRFWSSVPLRLQIQWKEQMRDKFGLDFRIVDSNLMKELRRKSGHSRQSLESFSPAHHHHRLPQTGAATAAVPRDFCPGRTSRLSLASSIC